MVKLITANTITNSTGYAIESSVDTDGQKFLFGSPQGYTADTTNRLIHISSDQFKVFAGYEYNSASPENHDTADAVRDQYLEGFVRECTTSEGVMAITERLMGTGNFTVTFSQEFTPTGIIESITEWGHIVVTPQEIDVDTLADSDILSTARYTGIVLNRELEEGFVNIFLWSRSTTLSWRWRR